MIQKFVMGFLIPAQAAKLILGKRSLTFLAILPIAVAVILYAVTFKFWLGWVIAKVTELAGGIASGWVDVLIWVVVLIGIAAFLILISATFVTINGLIASPFQDWLSESVDRQQGSWTEPPFQISRMVKVFWIDLKKTFITLILGGVLSLFFMIPLVGFAALPGIMLLMAFQFITYPLSRRHVGVRGSLRWMGSSFWECLGFGAGLTLGFGIPLINVLLIPAAVAGGTLLYLRVEQRKIVA